MLTSGDWIEHGKHRGRHWGTTLYYHDLRDTEPIIQAQRGGPWPRLFAVCRNGLMIRKAIAAGHVPCGTEGVALVFDAAEETLLRYALVPIRPRTRSRWSIYGMSRPPGGWTP